MIEKRLIILGSTGSIGTQTVEVVEHLNALADRRESPVRFRVVGLATGKNADALCAQAARLGVTDLAIADEAGCPHPPPGARIRRGQGAAERLVREVECDIVLGAMVGAAGLPATLAAITLGRDIALANKETLVAAGQLVIPAAQRSGSRLLPVDSEHCGVWQALMPGQRDKVTREHGDQATPSPCHPVTLPPCPPMACGPEITRIILTASGGPFRTASAEDTYNATPARALKHPTWQMGPKVTIDSASLTNKALEIVEAHWLFGIPGDKIDVLVHPQSIVHALVEFADGNVIAQLAPPDMRTPIQYALTFPHRPDGVSRKLDWTALKSLEFSAPDRARFPALDAAYDIINRGGTAGAVFNAANETAVEAFLAEKIPFGRITELSRAALESVGSSPIRSLADVHDADAQARRAVTAALHVSPRSRVAGGPVR
ncbi:MAG TPA: 1-deoxy-D-xylulose-5-phosphate reductoisomerase [Phycisphaerales bacterium]|nr:1-deoxy-D-xylulose-5-phosphate reductoisomerase [Phycisphaerales bacterium]